ncbi:hypothetical protein POSPLADRAFT_1075987 [Postia placenta MAD-698-R-SB12]|uniref:WH1 domain-containing protein n=1 Tax=Postia placenta MAD-698-R-SB12 TaxID=670580 RepID=A0A1X6MQ71_9APHY|nr:hypothetical protein POSPLADRAFT_1075987 [Postia placenta MAD-698-R-SB12]OSX58273.1 hypothetical protein POSPLADRAFT_1075987 [Postia placenta MAD-698-R-SB12]
MIPPPKSSLHPIDPPTSGLRLTREEERHIQSQLPSNGKGIAYAFASVYHAPFSGREDSWTSTGLKGMLVFGRNKRTDRPLAIRPSATFQFQSQYWFRLVDMKSDKGLIWIHDIPDDFQYRFDKPFFHTFTGKSRMYGLRFDNDVDAANFYKKLCTSQLNIPVHAPRKIRKLTPCSQSPQAPTSADPPRVKASMISSPTPGSFVHVGHVGYNEKGRIETSENLGPGWTVMIEELLGRGIAYDDLRGHGITQKILEQNKDFVEGFLKGADARGKVTGQEHGPERKRKSPHRKPVTLV